MHVKTAAAAAGNDEDNDDAVGMGLYHRVQCPHCKRHTSYVGLGRGLSRQGCVG